MSKTIRINTPLVKSWNVVALSAHTRKGGMHLKSCSRNNAKGQAKLRDWDDELSINISLAVENLVAGITLLILPFKLNS